MSEESKSQVARAGGIMVFALFLSRLLGLLRLSVMTYMFGRGGVTDAYQCAFSVPDLLFFLISGGALSSAFIPVFTEYLYTEREKDAWKVFSVVTSVMMVIVVAFVVGAWIFAEPLVHLVANKLSDNYVPLAVRMSRILLPAQIAFFIGGLMCGTLYARKIYRVPSMAPNIYNVGIILGAIVISHFVEPGIVGMAWGAMIGAFVGQILVPFIAMRSLGSHFSIDFDLKHPGVKKVFTLMLPVVLGLSLPAVYAIVMRWFATAYGEGIVSSIDYANMLMQAPLGVFGQSLAIAIFPVLSQHFAENRMDLYRAQVSSSLRQVMYLTIPISVFMFLAAPVIVSAMFQQGKFHSADTAVTADCLRVFAIGIAAWCLHPVLMRAFFAMQNSILPVILGTATTAVFVGMALGLQTTALGYLSLPLAGSFSAILLVIALGFAAAKKMGGIDRPRLFATFLCSTLGCVPVAAVGYAMSKYDYAGHGKLWTLGVLLLGFLMAAWLYFFATALMKMPEADRMTRSMQKARAKFGF